MSDATLMEEPEQAPEVVSKRIIDSAKALGIATEEAIRNAEAQGSRQGAEFDLFPDAAKKIALIPIGDGAYEWRDAERWRPLYESRRNAGDRATNSVTPLVVLPVEDLGENAIIAKLAKWDASLNPGDPAIPLRRFDPQTRKLAPIAAVPPVVDEANHPGGILLFVHGTFSLGQAIFDQLYVGEDGKAFLAWASDRYEHILSFEHPTLSVSPVLNGLDLARLFDSVHSRVDVICHSRGGLVTRWWLEAFGGARHGSRRVVFVSAPLGGTSLASPVKLREAMNLFSTVGSHVRDTLGAASGFMPFLNVGTMLAQIVVMATGTLAKTPLSDLFFSAVPGLGAMSRVGNQPELERLRGGEHDISDKYYAIRSDFHMKDAGWRFWRHFSKPGISQWGADQIFDQANDLVVDNRSTIELYQGLGLPPDRILSLPRNGRVHHTNYFTDAKVIGKLRAFLS